MPSSLLPPIAPYSRQPLPRERVVIPLVFPVPGATRWRSSYNEDWGTHRHTGCDIAAPKLTPILAPLTGTLGFKPQTFWIVGTDGWGCLGTHLNDDTPGTRDGAAHHDYMFAPNLRPGDTIQAGQLLGYVGDSGDARGPHLHLELHGPHGLRDPAPSLRAARRCPEPLCLIQPSPYPGLRRLDGCVRLLELAQRRARVIVVGEEQGEARIRMAQRPQWRTLTLAPTVLPTLENTPASQVVQFYCRNNHVERLLRPVPAISPPNRGPHPRISRLGHLTLEPTLSRCAAAELAHFQQLEPGVWYRTGSMALGPLRMRGIEAKVATLLGTPSAGQPPQAHPVVQEALRYPDFTHGAVADDGQRRLCLLLGR